MSGSGESVGWNELVVAPDNEAVAELRHAWAWLLKDDHKPVLFSAMGDMFFESASGDIHWLNTGTGAVSRIADNVESFRELLGTDLAYELFLPALIGDLIAARKLLKPGQCYSFITLPIFSEGTYSVENLVPMSIKEHFGLTGAIHEQLQHMPDGAKIRFKIVD